MIRYILVFVAVFALDFCWAGYVRHIGQSNAHKAAGWSTAIMLGSAFSTVSYVADHWAIIPALAGAYIGTWLAVKVKT